jgi:hypothetical protein
VANAQAVTVQAGASKAITLTGSDANNDLLTYAVVTPPVHGVLSGAAPNLTYTANPGFSGADSFTFKVNDGFVDSLATAAAINVVAPASTATPTNTPTATPTRTPAAPTVTATATRTPTATPTNTPAPAVPTASRAPTATSTPTTTPVTPGTPTATATATFLPTATAIPLPTATATLLPTATATPTNTAEAPTPTASPTVVVPRETVWEGYLPLILR